MIQAGILAAFLSRPKFSGAPAWPSGRLLEIQHELDRLAGCSPGATPPRPRHSAACTPLQVPNTCVLRTRPRALLFHWCEDIEGATGERVRAVLKAAASAPPSGVAST
jgi:hypothetical protein